MPRLFVLALSLLLPVTVVAAENETATIDGDTGLVIAEGFETVKAHCTVCHSGRLVAQSRADRDGWIYMIRWMQETQNLWPLGDNEVIILDYLVTNYGPEAVGRRKPLPEALMPAS